MDTSDIVTLAVALIALVGSIVSLFISARVAVKKERRQFLWDKEIERFIKLEALAGDLVESLAGYRPIPDDGTELSLELAALERAAGTFRRYPEVRDAIRDLHNVLHRILIAKRGRDDDRKIRQEIESAYQKFLCACDKIVPRPKI